MAKTAKLWLGLGTFIALSGTGADSATAAERKLDPQDAAASGGFADTANRAPGLDSTATRRLIAQAKQGMDGEKDHEDDAFSKMPRDQQLLGRLLLMLGHFRVGEELLNAGDVKAAMPHFHHPVEEIYKTVRPDLFRRGVRGFKPKLDAVMKASEAGDAAATLAGLKGARAAVGETIGKIDPRWKSSPRFVLDVVAALAQSAAEEYEEAVKDGRIANVVEYEDGRGFIAEAKALLDAHAAVLKAGDAAAFDAADKELAALGAVWPTLKPPAQPVKGPGAVMADASKLQLIAARYR